MLQWHIENGLLHHGGGSAGDLHPASLFGRLPAAPQALIELCCDRIPQNLRAVKEKTVQAPFWHMIRGDRTPHFQKTY